MFVVVLYSEVNVAKYTIQPKIFLLNRYIRNRFRVLIKKMPNTLVRHYIS